MISVRSSLKKGKSNLDQLASQRCKCLITIYERNKKERKRERNIWLISHQRIIIFVRPTYETIIRSESEKERYAVFDFPLRLSAINPRICGSHS